MANISIKQLKVFVTITQHSTMTAAAEALFLSKAAVSMALGEMEKQLGHSLFDRVNNRLVINQEGQKLLPLAVMKFSIEQKALMPFLMMIKS